MKRRTFLIGSLTGSLASLPMTVLAIPSGVEQNWSEDIDLLRDALLALHPGLFRYCSPAQIEHGFKLLRKQFGRTTLAEAYLHLSKFLATIRCGHTYANFYNQQRAVAESLFAGRTRLPFQFRWLDRRLIITHSFTGVAALEPGTEVLFINGTSSSDLLRNLMLYARADGHNDYKRRALLSVQGNESIEFFDVFQGLISPPIEGLHRLVVRGPGQTRAAKVEVQAIDLSARRGQRVTSDKKHEAAWKIAWPREDVAQLIMPTWALYDSKWDWRAFLAECFRRIRERPATHLIVDLRGNEGGEDECGNELLSYLISEPLMLDRMEQRVRYRKVADDLNKHLETWDDSFRDWGDDVTPLGDGFYRLVRNGESATGVRIEPNDQNFRGKLTVLVDADNSSATFGFAQAVQFNKLGRLVGEPTGGNKRGINGGAFFFLRLPASGFEVDVPLIGYFPKTPQPDEGLTPDVIVAPTIETIRANRDPALEFALGRNKFRISPN